jgi:hypothetical protein
LDLNRFIIPPSAGQPFPTPPQIPGPSPTPNEFEDAIKNTYVAIEPWVQYGFELGTYAVGWIPWVGWLAPQIMIFYFFGESIARTVVFNSADWLWGPLPFVEGYINIAQDKWDAVVQLGRDQLNFWLPGLPPLPFAARQTTPLTAVAPDVQATSAPTTLKQALHLLRDRFAVRSQAKPEETAQTTVGPPATPAAAEPAQDGTEIGTGEKPLLNAVKGAVDRVRKTAQEAVPATVDDVKHFTAGDVRGGKPGTGAPGTVATSAVTAQGEVRGAAAKATSQVAKPSISGVRRALRRADTDAPRTTTTNSATGNGKASADGANKSRDDAQKPGRNVHSGDTK